MWEGGLKLSAENLYCWERAFFRFKSPLLVELKNSEADFAEL